VQDSYLRWAEVDLATVRDTKSYLAQLVTSQAPNALRARARRREEYIGPWLPEPLLLDEGDASSDVVLAESVSMAMLVLLETLTPDERAVFVLRDVFGFDIRFEMAIYNSAPAVVIYDGEKLEGVFVFEVIDDVITNLYAMRNPDKLAGVTIPRTISRS
jgi:hypothetical protein